MVYKQSLLMTAGTVSNSLLGLGFYVLLARTMGVNSFGQFSYLLGLAVLSSEIGDFGMSASIVKFGADQKNFPHYFSFIFIQRVIICLCCFVIFSIWGNLESAVLASGLILASFAAQSLVSRQDFLSFALANNLGNIVRLTMTIVLCQQNILTVQNVTVVYFIGSITTYLFSQAKVFWEFKKKLFVFDQLNKTFEKIVSFSLPTAGSFGLASIAARADIPIIYALAGPQVVGIYSSAQKLVSILPQVLSSIDSVFAPKFSLRESKTFKNYLYLVLLGSFGMVVGSFIAPTLAVLIFGQEYKMAGGTLSFLLISNIPLFLSGPYAAKILYHHGKSKYHLLVSIIALVTSLLGYFTLIPIFGAVGAAIAVGLSNTVSLIAYVYISNLFSH